MDRLEISDLLEPSPVVISKDFANNTYHSDVIISFTSIKFKGSFKIEYFPGRYG